MALIYGGPGFRSHSLQWKLLPKNSAEQRTLTEIIRRFKYHAAPGINQYNPHFFDYPEQFDIDFHYNKYLYNIGPSVLTSLQVDYHGEGQALYHELGDERAPVSVVITASFQEVSIVTKKTIDNQNR
jgi:hypothetical protein